MMALSILLVLAYAVSYSGGVNLAAARNGRSALAREFAWESALNYALALLEKDAASNEYDALNEDWARPVRVTVGETEFDVAIRDEDRGLNINRAILPPKDPKKEIDLREVLEREVAAAGGDKADYDRLIAACEEMSPVLFIEELRRIEGLDENLFAAQQGKPSLDALLATHPEHINVNTAPPAVIEALWPDPAPGREMVRRRDDRPFEDQAELDEFLTSVSAPPYGERLSEVLSVSSDFFTVSVTPATGGGRRLTALARREGPSALVLFLRGPEQEGP